MRTSKWKWAGAFAAAVLLVATLAYAAPQAAPNFVGTWQMEMTGGGPGGGGGQGGNGGGNGGENGGRRWRRAAPRHGSIDAGDHAGRRKLQSGA